MSADTFGTTSSRLTPGGQRRVEAKLRQLGEAHRQTRARLAQLELDMIHCYQALDRMNGGPLSRREIANIENGLNANGTLPPSWSGGSVGTTTGQTVANRLARPSQLTVSSRKSP